MHYAINSHHPQGGTGDDELFYEVLRLFFDMRIDEYGIVECFAKLDNACFCAGK